LPANRYRHTRPFKVNREETGKLHNSKDLKIDVSRMWEVRTKIVPVTIGASGTVKKGFDQNRQLVSGHRSAIELQKFTLMSTAYNIGKCWGNRCGVMLRFGLFGRPPPEN
jgi:IMP dehydrogenase/GMP reductase